MSEEDFTTEAAQGQRDRRFHGGAPGRRAAAERARRPGGGRGDAGGDAYDPDDVPPATDDPVPYDPDADEVAQDVESVALRQEGEGDFKPLSEDNPYPPTRYSEE